MFVIFFDNEIMDIQEIRRKRLQLLIDKNYDGKQSAFIADTGANQGELSALLSGKRTFGERKARKIEKLARIEERWLDRDGEINLEISAVNTHARISVIPIVGAAKLGDKENYFVDLEYPAGDGDGGILFSTQDENAYALRCIGDSMTPRIKHGEFVIVEPNRPYLPGDEVVVKDKNGRVMVKVYKYSRDGMSYFESINQVYSSFGILDSEIEKIHYVAGIAKSTLKIE